MSVGGSLRTRLLAGILLPVLGYAVLNTYTLYEQSLDAADTAYDRTLLATAKSIGELLDLAEGEAGGGPRLQSNLTYSALEAFEADNRSRMYYRVSGPDGGMVAGFGDLPPPRPPGKERNVYAALVNFYDDRYRDEPVRMAVLLQPVSGSAGALMATVQVAETLELRHTLARALLLQTLWQQVLLVAVMALVVVYAVRRATRPVLALSHQLGERSASDLAPIQAPDAPKELQPVIAATNALLDRTRQLVEHQKRFVRDASHQLRTPLAVLKTQVQSARRGDMPPAQALLEIGGTVQRATELANQMLALAKVEQLRQQGGAPVTDWSEAVRAVALDLSALIADAGLDFDIDIRPAPVRAHEWALRELARNLLHNAVRHSPRGGRLTVQLHRSAGRARLVIADSGPGIGDDQRAHLFEPFATSLPDQDGHVGSGLGLAICREIVAHLGGTLALDNRCAHGRVAGLDAIVTLPCNPA